VEERDRYYNLAPITYLEVLAMSTFILGRIAKPTARPAYAERLQEEDADEKKHWVEALAAIIPGEALAAATAMLTYFTVKDANGAATLSHETAVRVLSLVIMLAIPIVYGASSGVILGKAHVVRWFAAMVAFAGWLWLLPLSVWDTFDKVADLDESVRAAAGVVAALVIASSAAFLFKKIPVPPTGGAT
jgi:hypothetical protein